MGDREEAVRQRERNEAAQRNSVQERVYQRYMAEKEEQAQKDADFAKKRDERIAREKEELRNKRIADGLPPDMSPEEIREANQAKVKQMWANAFDKVFGGIKN